ncbi:SMP-30/gluconolactonase/LRE family protein [Salinimicrobium flavum]|uniref:SMP-30/gluconolactonase/LRE family protein n=1 Tax=Salinimicrobium flavum TaxID=1737065 RepID=A0ABW5IVB5_9FLAO
MKIIVRNFLFLSFFVHFSCLESQPQPKTESEVKPQSDQTSFPNYSYGSEHIFPSDSLLVPEDGVGLPDGNILVSHDEYGLQLIGKDGKHRPFGNMREAGYTDGGARGVFLEDDKKYVLVSCIYSGELFRVNTETEKAELIYNHPYGINNIYRDRRGDIWISQSANNQSGTTEALDAAFYHSTPSGAVYRLKSNTDGAEKEVRLMADSLYFANGITMDAEEEHLLISEYRMDRITSFKVDREEDKLVEKKPYAYILTPDNLERDKNGNIWVASLLQNKIFAIDKIDKSIHTVFNAPGEINAQMQMKWTENNHQGKTVGEAYHPDMWKPLADPLTGIFWSHDREQVYLTGLGTHVLKYDYP